MKLRIQFFAALFWITLFLTSGKKAQIAAIAAFLHELGHFLAARLMGIRIRAFRLSILGARLETDGALYSYPKEFVLCVGGPAINLLCCLFLLTQGVLQNKADADILLFFYDSLVLGVLNLLPIRTFDGGRMLECILFPFFSPNTVNKLLSCLSFITVFTLWLLSVYFLIRTASSLSLFIFSIGLFAMLFL